MTTNKEMWLDGPEELILKSGELHVWRAWLDQQPTAHLAHLRQLLSPDEQERADRFHFPIHRERYIVARGTLRILLGRYLNRPPETITLSYGPQGKPALDDNSAGQLEFNVTHSEQTALFAFIRGKPVGVDVEHIRSMKDMAQMAKRFFSAEEYRIWQSVPPEEQDQAFFNCWTRKEAYIKVIGEGLSHPLNSFVVTLRPDEPGRLVTVDGSTELGKRWQMQALHPAQDYAAAVAVEGGWQRLRCWYFRPF
jgi:4'-phosphopantetheinyl transferase